ncbi:MAG TPA: helix-turn-helix transcriptional regulator [Pseudonocardia sp.]|jgi:poly-beta-hydroxybutyrate-responsive repressor|nr:helix-turn-helix transcriptional regulator [Pseudonocardia sp.]
MGECEPRNFLQPCLLLLLRERSDHGYDLVNRLRELHVVDGDAGAVYRSLRGLERNGLVRSSWQTSDSGPARRTYQVTAAGVADLNRQAVLLEATHQTLHVFRGRYYKLTGVSAQSGDYHEHSPDSAGSACNGAGGIGCPDLREGVGHAHGEGRHGHGKPDDRGVQPSIGAGERAGG